MREVSTSPNFKPYATWATVCVCLALFGTATALGLSAWVRYLLLFLGHEGMSSIIVPAMMLGCLALGHAWIGKGADRAGRPLTLFGCLALATGFYAILFQVVSDWTWSDPASGFTGSSFSVFGLSLVLSAVFVPGILAGGAMPILLSGVVRRPDEIPRRSAVVIGVTVAGLVLGLGLAAFAVIPFGGLPMAVLLAAGLYLLAGAVALGMSGYLGWQDNRPSNRVANRSGFWFRSPLFWLLALAGMGLAIVFVGWFRLFALSLGTGSHVWVITLSVALGSLAAGALAGAGWRPEDSTRRLAWLLALASLTLLVSSAFLGQLPHWFVRLSDLVRPVPEAYRFYLLLQAAVVFAVTFWPMAAVGGMLPTAMRLAADGSGGTGQGVGRVIAAKAGGAAVGLVLLTPMVLPSLGAPRSIGLGAAVLGAVGVGSWAIGQDKWRRLFWIGLPFWLIGIVSFVGARANSDWQGIVARAIWREASPPASIALARQWAGQSRVLHHRDGIDSTVSVRAYDADNQLLSLRVNGRVESTTARDLLPQIMSGHLPLILHPEAGEILQLGLGSGAACNAVLRHGSVERLDVVEPSAAVVEAAWYLTSAQGNPLEDQRLQLRVGDGKTYVQHTERRYDIVIGTLTDFRRAAIAGLFTKEHFQGCRRLLKDGGLVVQRVSLRDTDREGLETVLATFAAVFPEMSVWRGRESDLILVGFTQEPATDWEAMEASFRQPSVREHFAEVQVNGFVAFLMAELVSPANGFYLSPDHVSLHLDLLPRLEYLAQRGRFVRTEGEQPLTINELYRARSATLLGRYLEQRELNRADYEALETSFLTHGTVRPPFFRSVLAGWLERFPEDVRAVNLSAQLAEYRTAWEAEAAFLSRRRDLIMRSAETEPALLRRYLKCLLWEYRHLRSLLHVPPAEELVRTLREALDRDPDFRPVYYLLLAELAWDRGEDDRFVELTEWAFRPGIEHGPIRFDLDETAPQRALARLLELYLARDELEAARTLGRQVIQGGHLAAAGFYPGLQIALRKTLRAVGSDGETVP